MHRLRRGVGATILTLALALSAQAQWRPAEGRLTTPWTEDVTPDQPLPEYPRPQLVREKWTNLNGLWEYAIQDRTAGAPDRYEGHILVPFAVESALSGVKRAVQPHEALWYRRTFERPEHAAGERVLLHFGAVDWEADVFVNGRLVGSHAGGFDPFTFDITDALKADGSQELAVRVWDPTDTGSQPRGKQVLHPGGIFYTAVTGIWQTVWLELVPARHIRDLDVIADLANSSVNITVASNDGADATVEVRVLAAGEQVATASGTAGEPLTVTIDDPQLWTPDRPFLYDLRVTLEDGGVRDHVASYFGMRSIAVGKDEHGINRLLLNGEPLFQLGPLDQGWWPDGLYTAPTDEALRYDIEVTKRMGFNMIRKHVKVEPARWYYWCDKLGVLVWQDMPGGMATGGGEGIGPGAQRDADLGLLVREQFRRELAAMIESLSDHPSIVAWVPFNEGWGQHKTNEVLQWVKQLDPTRLVDGPSGWEDRGWGDMKDMHTYPGPNMFPAMPDRASVLGEFGGLGMPVKDHLWRDSDNWGYRTYHNEDDLRAHYEELIVRTRFLVRRGLAAAVYTQTTDVEGEVNGLLTYDRKVQKLPVEWLSKLHAQLYVPATPLKVITLVPTSEASPRTWRYTTAAPPEEWAKPRFDDSAWEVGEGPFGSKNISGLSPRSEWTGSDIWMRQEIELDEKTIEELYLRVFHDDSLVVYINGEKVADLGGFNTGYELIPLKMNAIEALRPGRNVIAIHCQQDDGPQGVDVGLDVATSE